MNQIHIYAPFAGASTLPAGLAPSLDPSLDPAGILARCWNDRLPDALNVGTITWWLRQVDSHHPDD